MSWSLPGFEQVAEVVAERTGLAFAPGRRESAEQGIRRGMARTGVADLTLYHDRLQVDAAALDDLIAELTVGETYFFREPDQFRLIRSEVLPEILQRRGSTHVIRAWSAGCASGEEPLSLAMLLAQAGLSGQSRILATDVSRLALAKACQGRYGSWSLRGEGQELASPYLTREDKVYRVQSAIRSRVTFDYLNLALDVYPSAATGAWGMDLILCRNVLIYFDGGTIARVARRLYDTLAEGGWLIAASSDPPLGDKAPFEVVARPQGVFYRRPACAERVASPAATPPEIAWIPPTLLHTAPVARTFNRPATPPAQTETPSAASLEDVREAFDRGDYDRVVQLTADFTRDVAFALFHVRALANQVTCTAERACARAARSHPLSPEVHHLHAVLLLGLGQEEEAARAIRRAIFLDRSLAVAHFTLGSILRERGDLSGAVRAYRNARDLCAARPADEVLPLGEGEPAGRLKEAAQVEMALLETVRRAAP